jgi:hypothetical protein
VAGLVAPSTSAQATGVEVHSQMEAYYLYGAQPKHPSAYKALPHLPERNPGILIEQALVDPDVAVAGTAFKGFIDWVLPGEKTAHIIDWKTTSDFKYGKSPDELARDVQMIAYAKWAQMKWPSVETVKVAHVYLKTKGGSDFRIVEATVGRKDVETTWGMVEATVTRMQLAAVVEGAENVTPNWNACNNFGGCPWRDRCGTQSSTFTSFASRYDMGLSDKLKGNTSVSILPPDAPPNVQAKKWEPPTITATTTPVTEATTSTGLHLYVDCLPVKGVSTATRLEDEIARRAAYIAQQNNVLDIRLIDYAKGKALLAAHFREEPLSGVVVAQSGDLSSVVIETLIPMASVVVRGVR